MYVNKKIGDGQILEKGYKNVNGENTYTWFHERKRYWYWMSYTYIKVIYETN